MRCEVLPLYEPKGLFWHWHLYAMKADMLYNGSITLSYLSLSASFHSYFLSTEESAQQRHLFRYNKDDMFFFFLALTSYFSLLWVRTFVLPCFLLVSVSTLGLFPRRCLTCGLREDCTFFDADVHPDAQHAILRCKGQREWARNPFRYKSTQ